MADTGTAAACSNVRFDGLRVSLSSRAAAYSAKPPRLTPNTSSPTANLVTFAPTAVTVPATASPGTRFFGPRRPKPMMRIRYGRPVMECHVPRSSPAACTRRSTSSGSISGLSMSVRCHVSLGP